MRPRRRTPVRLSLALVGLVLSLLAGGASPAAGETIRWDIVSLNFAAKEVRAGGVAEALAHDGSQIVLTGSGTFDPDQPETGGGTWKTFGTGGAPSGTGNYKVTSLSSWVPAPGTFPPLTDRIGDRAKARAGLVTLGIEYSDGSSGVLVVSCHLVGSPNSIFEGVTASKGFVSYFNRVPPVDGVDANRTLFHTVP